MSKNTGNLMKKKKKTGKPLNANEKSLANLYSGLTLAMFFLILGEQ